MQLIGLGDGFDREEGLLREGEKSKMIPNLGLGQFSRRLIAQILEL